MSVTLALLLAIVAAILAVIGIVRTRGDDLACWAALLLAAIFIIGR